MNYNQKERFYISEIIENPAITSPMFYILSKSMRNNEMLHSTLDSIHQVELERHRTPKNSDGLFQAIKSGIFPIYKDRYAVGYFGDRLMYLESAGWKSLPLNIDTFNMENWLI